MSRVWIDQIGEGLYLSRISPEGRRKRTKVADATSEGWKIAEGLLADTNRQLAQDALMGLGGRAPVLSQMADRYLREDTARLAPSTRGDRPSYLRPDGPLLRTFGGLRMDEITPAMLRAWWGNEVEALVEKKRRGELGTVPKRDPQTGRHYINVLQSIYAYAIELGLVTTSPVPAFRIMLQRHQRTKRGRAAKDPAQKIRPLSVDEMDRVVAAARAEGPEDLVVTLLCLDAGLRLGEAIGLTWGGVVPGADEMDATRHLYLDEQSNRPRGGQAGPPKSGRTRTVALSRRLRAALLELERKAFRPSPGQRVLDGVDTSNWRKRQWRRICAGAGIGHRAIKDLRDTYASQLLTSGVQLGYVSVQLGHSDVSVTADHYARWAGGDQYRAPVPLLPGEVPADLLARLGAVSAERQRSVSGARNMDA